MFRKYFHNSRFKHHTRFIAGWKKEGRQSENTRDLLTGKESSYNVLIVLWRHLWRASYSLALPTLQCRSRGYRCVWSCHENPSITLSLGGSLIRWRLFLHALHCVCWPSYTLTHCPTHHARNVGCSASPQTSTPFRLVLFRAFNVFYISDFYHWSWKRWGVMKQLTSVWFCQFHWMCIRLNHSRLCSYDIRPRHVIQWWRKGYWHSHLSPV